MLESLLSSNLVHLMLTFGGGMILALPIWYDKRNMLIKMASVIIALLVLYSFIFNVGEVYQFSQHYKRAFWHFGDDIPTVITLLACLALFYPQPFVLALLVLALLATVGKTAIILFVVMAFILIHLHTESRRPITRRLLLLFLLALPMYALGSMISNAILTRMMNETLGTSDIEEAGAITRARGVEVWRAEKERRLAEELMKEAASPTASDETKKKAIAKVNEEMDGRTFIVRQDNVPHILNFKQCPEVVSCIQQNAGSSIRERLISSLAGLWMTLQGGFPGVSGRAFADLMMERNPWGLNGAFNLTYTNWVRMALPQNPYMHFGAAYGLWMLLALVAVFGAFAALAVRHLRGGQRHEAAAFSVFFIVNMLLNQMQNYIVGGSILLVMGLCAGRIVLYDIATQPYWPTRLRRWVA